MDERQREGQASLEARSATNGATKAGPGPGLGMRVQNDWLRRMHGKAIAIRLQSGEVISGVLEADDTYTLALHVPGFAETALIYKHSIEYLVPATKR